MFVSKRKRIFAPMYKKEIKEYERIQEYQQKIADRMGEKQWMVLLLFCYLAFIGCKNKAVVVDGQIPDFWNQNVYNDSLSAEPSHADYLGIYALGMDYSPIESLTFLPYTILNDYWKTTHYFSFKDSNNHLVFEEYMHGDEVYSYPLIYASITDSRICLEKKLHTGMRRDNVLRLLKLKNVDNHIQTICLIGFDSSSTFYFADGLLKKIVLRTDRSILHNPDPVFEYRHAGQVRGYTGKRLYAVANQPNNYLSPVCYINERGDTIIPYGQYSYCVSDSIAPVGFVLEPKAKGITCINTEGKVMCRAYVVDNLTPDYLFEGHFRIVNEEGLMGFADSLGHVVVTPQYKFALPFQGGKAKVTYTGHKSDPNDEHWEWVSNDWFYIDYKGQKLP